MIRKFVPKYALLLFMIFLILLGFSQWLLQIVVSLLADFALMLRFAPLLLVLPLLITQIVIVSL
jgi:hypothetical protein